MEQAHEKIYNKLVTNLEDLTKIYRNVLELVRKEKELLIDAKIDELNDSNKQKELMLYKLKQLDLQRERIARELAHVVGADSQNPRLLELAQKMGGEAGDKLRMLHSTLEILIKRITELNRDNEQYAQAGLERLNGAIGNIKETLVSKTGYEKKGKVTRTTDTSGNLVRKEV
jgi:hypothetical protein